MRAVFGDIEHRAFEVRASAPRKLTGYAAQFNTEATIGSFTETVAPGAFGKSLKSDVLALMDHDAGKVLGRTKSGTLELREDDKGLAFSLSLPDTQAGRDVMALAERGDLGGASFGFTVSKEGQSWEGYHRTLRSVSLKEISVISAWPAYEKADFDIALRHADWRGHQMRRARILILAELAGWV